MSNNDNHVVITDIKMPFMSMVTFMVKWVRPSNLSGDQSARYKKCESYWNTYW